MKCKIIIFVVIVLSLIGIEYKINKIDTVNTKDETAHVENQKSKLKKEKKKVAKVKPKKSKKEKQLEYWSGVTGKKVIEVTNVNSKLSFYTSLECENSSYGSITASGISLRQGVCANNLYPMGTTIYFEGYGEYEILDRGGKGLNTWNNFDIFVPRNYGESDSTYYKRINNKGIRNAKGYILKFKEE